MTAVMILDKVRRIGWKTSVVLGLFLLLYAAASIGLSLYGLEGWMIIIYAVCDLIIWIVVVLYCCGDADKMAVELGLLLFLSLLGPIGIIVVISVIANS